MDVATCEARIDNLVLGMANEGILNHQFYVLLIIRRAGDHLYLAKVIHDYCNLIERNLTEFSDYLREPNIDYARATVCAGHLRIQTCCVGAKSIGDACLQFFMASQDGNKEQCVFSLHSLYREYFRLRTKFMEILQMEMRILYLRDSSYHLVRSLKPQPGL